jgi:uroporphyrinogen decarboxylase
MNGKELVLRTLRHESVPRVAWVPYTGVHIGSLTGNTATELLKDGAKLLESLRRAHKLYSPDGMPVVFDLQVEAEILGCGMKWAQKAPPSVISHPLAGRSDFDLEVPARSAGRIPLILETARKLHEEVGGRTAIFGLVCGPLTLASHLRGTQFFLDFRRNEALAHKLVEFTKRVALRMAGYYLETGIDVLAVVDPLISQISPAHFNQFFAKPYAEIFAELRSRRALSSFFVCGDATKNVEVMCQTGPDSIAIDENIDIVKAKAITDRHNITIMGNIPLTAVMLLGNQQDNQKCVVELLDKMGKSNFILAPGCDMPFAVPQENVIGISQAVQNVEQTRLFLKNYVKKELDLEVDMPDYAALAKPLIEVFTIDSETCAACTYMKATAFQMLDFYGGKIQVVERKGTEAENIVRMQRLGIKNLPAILINGQLRYSSVIPDTETLKEDVRKLL